MFHQKHTFAAKSTTTTHRVYLVSVWPAIENNLSASKTMARFYSEADMRHNLAYIAPKSRSLYVVVDFEVFGNIHGIYYTKYAKEMAHKLRIGGWIRFNNKRGSVVGQIEGEKSQVDQMANWLKLQGAPGSRIDHCEFRGWQIVDTCSFRDFRIRF